MMKRDRRSASFALAFLVALSCLALWPTRGAAFSLPPANDFNSAKNGDFLVYSLPLLGISVSSTAGAIKDGIVVYTGSSGDGVTTNFSGMDDAFPSVTGNTGCPSSCYFSTQTTADPGGFSFTGDTQSWDSTLSAFLAFLGGNTPLFLFSQNEANSATPDPTLVGGCGMVSAQDLCAYGLLTLRSSTNPALNQAFEFGAPTHLTSEPGFFGTPGSTNLPAEYVLAKGEVCLDSTGAETPCDGSGNPVVIGPVNHNLGADNAAYAILSPALNAALSACQMNGIGGAGCPWDSLSIRLDLDGLSNGFDQFFILTENQVTVTPEPMTMFLGGTGLMLLGYAARRRLAQ